MRKKLFSFIVGLVLVFTFVLSSASPAEAYSYRVRGYTRSNGTYVNSYHRTSPNYTRFDNYSTKGNYNSYTGRFGTKSLW